MNSVRTLVLRAPGTNCDAETAYALKLAGAEPELVFIGELLSGAKLLADYGLLVIPGGFVYGDDLGAGKVLANELRLRLGEALARFTETGGLVLGICNGFQVLVKLGLLPGPLDAPQRVTLANNDSGRFECRWTYLSVNQQSQCVFTRGIERLYLPVAHGEGKLVAGPDELRRLNAVVYYVDECGNRGAGYPDNPSGTMDDIAGICNDSGRVFALMPHPERHVRRVQHPRWTRGDTNEPGDGLVIFKNAVAWVRGL